MTEFQLVPIAQLRPRLDARTVDFATVDALAESIRTIGRLLNPIVIREAEGGLFEIVAGVHRFCACDRLGWSEIPCRLETLDDARAELAMIDENLCRAELTPADRASQTARRKAIYEALHPETRQGVAGGNARQGAATDKVSFADATAGATGRNVRSVQRDAQRGAAIEPAALSALQGTKLDSGRYLDGLSRVPREEQAERVRSDLAQPRQTVERPAPQAKEQPGEAFTRFLALANEIEALGVRDIIAAAGKQRPMLGQRANGLGSMMDDIGEGLNHA